MCIVWPSQSELNAWSLSLAARQENTGAGVRREGADNNKRPLARHVGEETGQSWPPDWCCRVRRPETAVEHITLRGGFVLPLASWLPPSSRIFSSRLHFGQSSLKGKRASCWRAARLEAGSLVIFVILKLKGKMWGRKLKGVLIPHWRWAMEGLAFKGIRW